MCIYIVYVYIYIVYVYVYVSVYVCVYVYVYVYVYTYVYVYKHLSYVCISYMHIYIYTYILRCHVYIYIYFIRVYHIHIHYQNYPFHRVEVQHKCCSRWRVCWQCWKPFQTAQTSLVAGQLKTELGSGKTSGRTHRKDGLMIIIPTMLEQYSLPNLVMTNSLLWKMAQSKE